MSDKSSTISITYKFKGDNSGLKDLVSNVERMQQAFRDGVQPADQLQKTLINFNQIARSFEQIGSAVSQLNGVVQELSRAYSVQIEAETKLQTVMQERMGATSAEIQSIKDLCSAQQELGIIGDEVQLAGAQQLATFLDSTTALQTLIPAMNNLVAQQKGFNATSSDTVSIANLLGKAMQGQASALRRVGITFTDAEEAALKTGTEFDRASVLAQIITNNVGEMNAALAQTDAGRAKQLSNALGDVKEKIGGIVSGIAPYMTFVSAIVATTANAGRAAAAMRGLMSATFGANGALKFISTSAVASAFGMNAAGTAARFLAAGLRMILAATGVGLVIWGITAAVDAFTSSADKAKESTDEMTDSTERLKMAKENLKQTIGDTRAQLELDIATTKRFNGTKAQEKKIVDELNQRYGQTMGYFARVADWYKALVANSEAYCRQMEREATARMYANMLAEEKKKQWDITHNADGSTRYYDNSDKTREASGPARQVMDEDGRIRWHTSTKTDKDRAQDEYNASVANTKAIRSAMEKEVGKDPIKIPVVGAATPPSASTSSTGRGGSGASAQQRELTLLEQIEQQIRANQDAALTADKATYDSLMTQTQALVKQRDELRAKQEALVTPPKVEYTPPQIDEIETFDQLDQALSHYQKKLGEAEEDSRQEIFDTIVRLQDLRQAWEDALDPPEKEATDLDNYIDSLVDGATAKFKSMASPLKNMGLDQLKSGYQEIQNLLEGMDGDITEEQRESLKAAADEYRKYASEAVNLSEVMSKSWGDLKGIGNAVESITSALEDNKSVWQQITAVVDGCLQIYQGIMGIIEIVRTLTEVSKMTATAKTAEAAATASAATATAVEGEVGASMIPEKTAEATAAKLAATGYMELAAAKYFAAHADIPFAGFGIATGFVASAEAIVKSIGAMPFAQGGIISGPTLGLIGEYAGARSNPEVVAPLDRLRSLIGDTRGVALVAGEFKVRGRDLVAVIGNETKIASKSGRKINF